MASKPLIMIVEDEPMVAFFVAELLEERGYMPSDVFPTNSAALAWLEKNRPDAAILDLGLRDGRSNRTAAHLAQSRIPFLVVSGFDRSEDLGQEFDAAHWLCKPFRPTPFYDAIERLLAPAEVTARSEVVQMSPMAPRTPRLPRIGTGLVCRPAAVG